LLDAGWDPQRIVVAGDSAGGGLTLALGVAAVQRGMPLPGVLGLLCPGVDVTPEAEATLPQNRREPILTTALLHRFVDAYAVPQRRGRAYASPLLADLTGLPPLVIDTAEHDILLSQSRRLARRAKAAGVRVRYREHAGMSHGFHSAAGILRRADRAIDDITAELLAAQEHRLFGADSPKTSPEITHPLPTLVTKEQGHDFDHPDRRAVVTGGAPGL
jgi:acetyl esterase/lipase